MEDKSQNSQKWRGGRCHFWSVSTVCSLCSLLSASHICFDMKQDDHSGRGLGTRAR